MNKAPRASEKVEGFSLSSLFGMTLCMGSGFGVRGWWLEVYGVKGQGLGVGGGILSVTVDALLGA